MLPELSFTNLPSHLRVSLRHLLRGSPWCWPDPRLQPEAFERAQGLAELVRPPFLPPGVAPLVSVERGEGTLSLIDLGGASPPKSSRHQLGVSAELWEEALEQCGRTLPLLWRATRPRGGVSAIKRPEHARFLAGKVPALLEGDSFGLSFALAQASTLLEQPLPPDVVASAALGPNGVLRAVTGLSIKALSLVDVAPRIRRILVAASQPDREAVQALLGRKVEVIPCETVGAALALALPSVEPLWLESGQDPHVRARRVQVVFELVLEDRCVVPEWARVRRAAELALEGNDSQPGWPDLTGSQRVQLQFARAVAARHDGAVVELPPEEQVCDLLQPDRSRAAAHVVQQAVEAGAPPSSQAMSLADVVLGGRRGREAFPADLRLLGARARLLDRLGHHEESLAEHLELAELWIERGSPEASYPLAEAYRLAVALRDRTTWDRLEALIPSQSQRSPWAEHSRARGLLQFAQPNSAKEVLSRLLSRPRLPAPLRVAVEGTLRQAHAALGEDRADLDRAWQERREGARQRIAEATQAAERESADQELRWLEHAARVAQLHDAVQTDSPEAARDAADALVSTTPERLTVLRDQGRRLLGDGWPAHLLRHLP